MRDDVVVDGAGLDDAGPADDLRHAVAAFPGRALRASERGIATVGPAIHLRAVVGGDEDEGVLQAEVH